MRFAREAWHAAISWPSILLAVVLTALTLHGVSEAASDPGVNGWDVAVVQVSNLQLVPLVIAVVWAPVFLARHRALQREDELLRRGSWRKAVAAVVISDAAIIIGALTLSTAAVLAVSASLGLDGGWSDRVVGIVSSGGLDSEVSAAPRQRGSASGTERRGCSSRSRLHGRPRGCWRGQRCMRR